MKSLFPPHSVCLLVLIWPTALRSNIPGSPPHSAFSVYCWQDVPLCLSGTDHSAAVSQTLPASMEPCLITALPNSQAAKVRPQVHLGRQMLVLFVMTFAKTCTLLLTSFRRMVDTKGPWKRTFKKLCGGIKVTEAEMLASCSNQGSLVFPSVLCIWPGSPQAAAPTVQHVEGRFLWQHQTHSYQETKRKLSVVKGKKSFL